ncbi:hypothetical protein LIER_06655 [Lithospermum erythrorhizon]|uniref:GFO/IDH/MocA-like oxidoreductase domain-containing protein n=1 Tax=Lithospermum erythrorhizon TaxID=34254 RepID=A0AAV3P711_LITER
MIIRALLILVQSSFTFAAESDFLENDIRVKPDLDALGALGDAGWYCIRATLLAANYELPKSVLALPGAILNKSGVILACSASLHWEDGRVATFHTSFLANLTMDFIAVGTKGTLTLHDLVIPFEEKEAAYTAATESNFAELFTGWVPLPSNHTVVTDFPQDARMVNEFSRLVQCIKNENAKPEMKWPTMSRKTQLITDAVKTSIERGFQPVEIAS